MKLLEVLPDKCSGCRLCEMVCSLAHEGECSTAKSRIKIFRDEEFGNNLISVCLQCADAYCVESCAYGALSRDDKTGVVLVDDELCNVCEIFITACPLGAISLNKEREIVFKCDLCGGDPECVKICSRGALVVKDIDPASADRKSFMTETAELLRQM